MGHSKNHGRRRLTLPLLLRAARVPEPPGQPRQGHVPVGAAQEPGHRGRAAWCPLVVPGLGGRIICTCLACMQRERHEGNRDAILFQPFHNPQQTLVRAGGLLSLPLRPLNLPDRTVPATIKGFQAHREESHSESHQARSSPCRQTADRHRPIC